MKKIGKFVIIIICTLFANLGLAQVKGTVYVFGIGDSMRDSVVYFTSIQRIDNANLQKRTKFVLDRSYFSQQLKNYFAKSLNDPNRLCVIYCLGSEKKALKKQMKVRSDYLDEGALVKQLSQNEFQFTPILNAVYESKEIKGDITEQ